MTGEHRIEIDSDRNEAKTGDSWPAGVYPGVVVTGDCRSTKRQAQIDFRFATACVL